MSYRAILLAVIVCAAARARAESPDPSYEPDRYAKPSENKPKSNDKKSKTPDATVAVEAPVRVEVQAPAERRVLLILNGRPIYEDDPDAQRILAEIKADTAKQAKPGAKTRDKKAAPADAGAAYAPDSQPKYQPVRVGDIQPVTPPAATLPPAPVSLVDDLTADKPGTPAAVAAQQQALLDDMPSPGGLLSSRAKDCYALLAKLKENVETISRCLDNRGKENAKLIHASDQAIENLSDLAAIWPRREDYLSACASAKRDALLLSSELSQTPWRWKQVRWRFDTLLANVRSFRVYAKAMAENEKPPVAVTDDKGRILLDKKTGKPIYRDVPDDPPIDKATAIAEAENKAAREELQRAKRKEAAHDDADKNRLEVDLSHVKP